MKRGKREWELIRDLEMGHPWDLPNEIDAYLLDLPLLEAKIFWQMVLAKGGGKVYVRPNPDGTSAKVEILTFARLRPRLLDAIREFNARGQHQILGIT